MVIWSYIIDKNCFHKEICDIIDTKFQSYEPFYRDYILNFIDPNEREWIRYKEVNIDNYSEIIGMADFGIIKSLVFINRNRNMQFFSDGDQVFKNLFLHYTLIFDNMEHIGRQILRLKKQTDDIPLEEKIYSAPNICDFIKWKKELPNLIRNHIDKGKMISPPGSKKGFLEILHPEYFSKFESFRNQIRAIRNRYGHNPSVDIFRFNGNEYCPSPNHFGEYRLWTDIKKDVKKNGIRASHLKDPKILINDTWDELFDHLNNYYRIFHDELSVIYGHENILEYLPPRRDSSKFVPP